MPWGTPSLTEVRRLGRDFMTAKLPGSEAAPPNSRLRALTDGNSGNAHLALLYLDWLALQLLPDTAEAEWLDRHGQIWLGGRLAATYAEGSVTVTGVNGTILPIATRLTSGEIEYETTEAITIGSGPTPVDVQSLTAGVAANRDAGAALGLDATTGVDGTALVVTLTGGVDEESDESLRERVLFRIRKPPMGGDADDYIAWARSVAGVTRAWSAPLEMGIGTVTVRFMMDDLRSNDDPDFDGFPLAADILGVKIAIDAKRPVAVKDFFVVAPIPQAINFSIAALSNDTLAVRSAIEASVRAMIKDRASPGQTIYRSWLDEAISAAVGEDHHELTFASTAMASAGHLAVLGTISYA